jgi:hypothetical protein
MRASAARVAWAPAERNVFCDTSTGAPAEDDGGGSSSEEDGITTSSDEEGPTTPKQQGTIPSSTSTIWAQRWKSSVPAAGLYPVAPLAEEPSTPPPAKPPARLGACAMVLSAVSELMAAIPIALLSYATSTSYAMLIVEGTAMEAELVVAMQLFGSAVSGVAHALGSGSRCPPHAARPSLSPPGPAIAILLPPASRAAPATAPRRPPV